MIGRLEDWKIGRFDDLAVWRFDDLAIGRFGDLMIGRTDALKQLVIKKMILVDLNIF